jgi:hypothetical protein
LGKREREIHYKMEGHVKIVGRLSKNNFDYSDCSIINMIDMVVNKLNIKCNLQVSQIIFRELSIFEQLINAKMPNSGSYLKFLRLKCHIKINFIFSFCRQLTENLSVIRI